MKEAVVKAYEGRVSMRDVSIVPLYWRENFFPTKIREKTYYDFHSYAPVAVIEPPNRWVLIPEDVASYRGLSQSSGKLPDSDTERFPYVRSVSIFGKIVNGKVIATKDQKDQKFFLRRLTRNDDEREVAHISLSHDGNLISAVCIASSNNPSRSKHANIDDGIIDDGHGEPIHEPTWGDVGWKSALMLEQYTHNGGPFEVSLTESDDTDAINLVDQIESEQ